MRLWHLILLMHYILKRRGTTFQKTFAFTLQRYRYYEKCFFLFFNVCLYFYHKNWFIALQIQFLKVEVTEYREFRIVISYLFARFNSKDTVPTVAMILILMWHPRLTETKTRDTICFSSFVHCSIIKKLIICSSSK